MSSSVCQGLDFNVFNTSVGPSLTESEVHKEQKNLKSNDNIEVGGWSFLQSLTKTSEIENEKVYVHPLRSSSSKLSTKSLEMCTESLGNETGSNCSESSDEIHFTSSLEQLDNCESSPKYYKNWVTEKRMKCSASFPPPLTSICRTNGVQLRPHREGGRLVLKAESVSSCITYFEAERSDGRLRLRLLQNCSPDCNHDHEAKFEEEDEEEEE
ncbi:protein FANTASTIC FOUR 3-like, partial [Tripterygium wilfordii]